MKSQMVSHRQFVEQAVCQGLYWETVQVVSLQVFSSKDSFWLVHIHAPSSLISYMILVILINFMISYSFAMRWVDDGLASLPHSPSW